MYSYIFDGIKICKEFQFKFHSIFTIFTLIGLKTETNLKLKKYENLVNGDKEGSKDDVKVVV